MCPLRLVNVNANSVQKHKLPSETIHQFFFIDVKMLLCTRKLFFCLLDLPNQFRPFFFKLGPWHAAKTRPWLLRFFHGFK